MSVRDFEQELKRGLPRPAYLLHSTEEFLLYESLSLIREQQGGTDVFNFEVLDADSPDSPVTTEQVLDAANTLPMMAPRRTVVLRNLQSLPKKETQKLDPYLQRPAATTLLVMLFSGKPPKGHDLFSHRGVRIIPLQIRDAELPQWVKKKGALLGKSFTDGAVQLLIESVGTDLGMLYSEVEKFASCSSATIGVDDVKAVVYAGIEYSGFDLVNALLRGNRRDVFRIYMKLSRTIEPYLLIGALNRQFSRLWATQYRGDSRKEKKFSMIVGLLHQADVALKTSHEHVMEDLLVKLLKIRP
jgi:DNA polymerase-3 subunit delta